MMTDSTELERQVHLLMHMIAEVRPGCVCYDTRCTYANFSGVPHMANDGGAHPHPYGVIESPTHEWRRKRWWRRGARALVDNGWKQ